MDRLQEILEDGIIDEIYSQLKTGKEAEVWLVSHRGEPVAAKLYKAREFRSFKNDAGYREGRTVRNSRTQRAMDRGSKFGREASEEAWKSAEADALAKLHAAGVRVPRPVLFYEGVLLMEVIGDAEGRVAPRLVDAHIPPEQALGLYTKIRGEVIKMLSADLIHGDLSEFNILLANDGPVIIDFPQVVMAAKNSQSEQYFRKDLGNMVRFFSSVDPTLAKHASDIDEIWRAYVRRELSPSYVPSGRSFSHPRGNGAWAGAGAGGDHRRGAGHEARGGRGAPSPGARSGTDGPGPRRPPPPAPPRRGPEVTILGGRGDGTGGQPPPPPHPLPARAAQGPGRNGASQPQPQLGGRSAPARNGQSQGPGRNGPPPARNGQSQGPGRNGPPPARDGQGQGPGRNGPPPARDGQGQGPGRNGPPPAQSSQPPARSAQPLARNGQPPARVGPPQGRSGMGTPTSDFRGGGGGGGGGGSGDRAPRREGRRRPARRF